MLFGRRGLFPAQLADQVIHLIQSLLLLMDLLQQAAAAPPQQPKPLPDCIRSLFRQPDKVLQRAQFHPGLLQKPKRNCPLQRFLPIMRVEGHFPTQDPFGEKRGETHGPVRSGQKISSAAGTAEAV